MRVTQRTVEVWMQKPQHAALSAHARRLGRPMGHVLRQWLSEARLAVSHDPERSCETASGEIPRKIPWRDPGWTKVRLRLPIADYQRLRLAAARRRLSQQALLHALCRPHLVELTAGDDGQIRAAG